jgi:phosphoribosyl 1,2-cyclic phosphodiesterase/FixJ family two-component response regulator
MRVQFWGTRGSIAKAGAGTVRYGGNTSCVEVRSSTGTLLVLDCGTGAHALGQSLVTSPTSRRGHMLITHTHWDHIQGFPFFAPLYRPGDEWDVYAPRGLRESVRDTLAGQMQYVYFPVSVEQFAATIRYHDLVEGAFTIGDVHVTARYLNHPALTLGYRLEADGVTVVYATDHEPHSRDLAEGRVAELSGEDRRHVEFLAGADLLIHDAQYTAAEYARQVGWGHSTVESVVTLAREAGARRLALFHHDPLRDDGALDRVIVAARARAAGTPLDVFAAAEGLVIDVAPVASPPAPAGDAPAAQTPVPAELLDQSVLLALDDAALGERLAEAVRADGLTLVTAADGEEVLALVRSRLPSLLLVGRWLGGRDGLELCRALRKTEGGAGQDLPIVIVASHEREADRPAGAEAGVTDWLVAPFSTLYARTRIRAWALRQACRWMRAPLPADEPARVRALDELGILDSPPEERFDRITRLARRLFDMPIALVSLVATERQWFKSRQGLDVPETSRDSSFCAHAILDDQLFVVGDASLDPRFAESPLVTGAPGIRFYAGRPVRSGDFRIGTLCLIDRAPRQLGADDMQVFEDLAALVENELARTRTPPTPPAS